MKFRIQVKGLVVFIVIVLAMRTTVAGNPLDTSEYGLNPELAAKLGNSVLSVIEDNPPADRKIDVLVSCDMDLEPDYISEVKRRTPNLAMEEVWENLGAFRTTASPNMILKLTEISFVKRVDKNTDISPCLDTAREETDVDWWTSEMPDFQGDKDGNKTFYSRDDIVIAVLDTGIDTGHKDLDEGKVIAWKDIWGERRDWAEEEPNPVDENGHGTHCASIAAGTGDSISDYRGVAPHAALV
ncbi:MAG: S8 family serine peptidase, partial [Promethearchaeia archaeon]